MRLAQRTACKSLAAAFEAAAQEDGSDGSAGYEDAAGGHLTVLWHSRFIHAGLACAASGCCPRRTVVVVCKLAVFGPHTTS